MVRFFQLLLTISLNKGMMNTLLISFSVRSRTVVFDFVFRSCALIYMQDMSENVEEVMIHNFQYVHILL